MDEKDGNLLIRACGSEGNPVTRDRIHAACVIKISGLEPSGVASLCHRGQRAAGEWIRRLGGGGPAGLGGRPRPGGHGGGDPRVAEVRKRADCAPGAGGAAFASDPEGGAEHWSRKGVPAAAAHRGGRDRVAAHGAPATDGRRFARTREKFSGGTFLARPKALVRHSDRVALIPDNAPRHRALIVRECLGDRPSVRVMWPPRATPEPGVAEERRHQPRRDLPVGGHYSTAVRMRHALSEYFRAARPKLDAAKFVNRRSLLCKNL